MLENKAVDLLPEDGAQWRCQTLLDENCVDPFLTWLDNNPDFVARLVDKRWSVAVLKSHVERRPNWAALKERLTTNHIQIVRHTFNRKDEMLVAEMQHAYFGSDAASIRSAQLLAYGRLQSEDGADVRIISRHRGFRLASKVQFYFLPNVPDIGQDDEAMFLRTLLVLDLHRNVRRGAYERILNREYPSAVSETMKMLIDEIRQIGISHGLPFTTEVNDQPLVDKALNGVKPDATKNRPATLAPIQLNDFILPSEWSEQKGYHDIMCGAVSAVRNPTAHAPMDEPFVRDRFGDRRTALKFLCLLSLLFEKLDKRVAPR